MLPNNAAPTRMCGHVVGSAQDKLHNRGWVELQGGLPEWQPFKLVERLHDQVASMAPMLKVTLLFLFVALVINSLLP